MITHKNTFTGSLGKLQNIGGSRAFTTPNTVPVPQEYTITVNYNITGDLTAHSLDGRLWLYRRSRRLGVVALKWNKETAKLEYSAAQNLSNNDDVVLACGLDWVLTNNNIFMVTDKGEIRSARLFDANMPDTFLYSLLRTQNAGNSYTDPFTKDAWGRRNDNGNSEGNGYFSKATHLLYPAGSHSMEQCYSFLPAVGDWQIVENFLVRRPDKALSESYNSQLNLRPLIPLEFKKNTPAYGTGYNLKHRGIQLAYKNGQIWGRGLYNIGRVSILPAVFDENGKPLEYYLYISPDYPCSPFRDEIKKYIDTETGKPQVFNDHAYLLIDTPATWNDAQSICQSLGGHLATVTSQAENDFLLSVADGNDVWLGGTFYFAFSDLEHSGLSLSWVTNEDLSYTNNLDTTIRSSEDTFYLYSSWVNDKALLKTSSTWENAESNNRYKYICEWEQSDTSEAPLMSNLADNDWLNTGITAHEDGDVFGFLSGEGDITAPSECITATEAKIFLPQSNEWVELSDEESGGVLFVDALSSLGLMLNDNGAILLNGGDDRTQYDCKTIQQWLAPAGKVDAVGNGYVVASTDNSVLLTSIATGFNRQALSTCAMPLSAKTFTDNAENQYRLAISESVNDDNRKFFGINSLQTQEATAQPIAWEDIYKPVEAKLINKAHVELREDLDFEEEYGYTVHDGLARVPYTSDKALSLSFHDWYGTLFMNIIPIFTFSYETRYIDAWTGQTRSEFEDEDGDWWPYAFSCKAVFLNPENGFVSAPITLSYECPYHMHTYTDPDTGETYRYVVPHNFHYDDLPIFCTNNKIYTQVYVNNDPSADLYDARENRFDDDNYPFIFIPLADIPDYCIKKNNFFKYWNGLDGEMEEAGYYKNFSICSVKLTKILAVDEDSGKFIALFQEEFTHTIFTCCFSCTGYKLYDDDNDYLPEFYDYPDDAAVYTDNTGLKRAKINYHIAINDRTQYNILFFKTTLDNDTFSFQAEFERSYSA